MLFRCWRMWYHQQSITAVDWRKASFDWNSPGAASSLCYWKLFICDKFNSWCFWCETKKLPRWLMFLRKLSVWHLDNVGLLVNSKVSRCFNSYISNSYTLISRKLIFILLHTAVWVLKYKFLNNVLSLSTQDLRKYAIKYKFDGLREIIYTWFTSSKKYQYNMMYEYCRNFVVTITFIISLCRFLISCLQQRKLLWINTSQNLQQHNWEYSSPPFLLHEKQIIHIHWVTIFICALMIKITFNQVLLILGESHYHIFPSALLFGPSASDINFMPI